MSVRPNYTPSAPIEKIKNSDILISNRLLELQPIKCANALNDLVGNRCYTSIANRDPGQYTQPYPANCPINYDMYPVSSAPSSSTINRYDMQSNTATPVNNNKYICYKNCIENTKGAEIRDVAYSANTNGKQCIRKSYLS
jgi:hypothetical protein